MDKHCPVSRVVTWTGVKITSLSSLSSSRAWTSGIRAASVKLSGVDMLLILSARSDVLGERSL